MGEGPYLEQQQQVQTRVPDIVINTPEQPKPSYGWLLLLAVIPALLAWVLRKRR